MRNVFYVIGLLFLLAVTGCASEVERTGFDSSKAAAANAELGIAYLSKGNNKVAMEKLKKALAFDEGNIKANHYIAELYRRLGQNDLAKKYFEIALDLDGENSAIKNNYGIFLCGIGSYQKAVKLFNEVLANPLYADKGQVYENMGLCAEKQGNIFISEKYFITALKFNRNLPAALLGLAQIEFDKKRLNKAISYLNRHKKIVRVSSQSLWLELLIERKKGNKGKVGTLAIKLKQYFPDSQEVQFLKKLNFK